MSARPRQLVHRGRVEARGVVLAPESIGVAAARARVLTLWHEGARLTQVADRWVLRFAAPRDLDADVAPGAPLVEQRGVLSTMPLSAHERAPTGTIIIGHGGATRSFDTHDERPIDPSTWLDLEAWTVVDVRGIGARPAPLAVAIAARELPAAELLGPDVTLDPARLTTITALNAPRHVQLPNLGATDVFAKGGSWWTRIQRWLDRRFFARAIGNHNARYLGELLAMFDRGETVEALRHALPLAREPSATTDDRPLKLGPRDALEVTSTSGGRGSLGLHSDLFALLRHRYRSAAANLTAAGRHSEVAFILAELLNQPLEAVQHLELYDRFAEAARLAETRGLDPALIIRLWCKAGDVPRASALARRHRAFATVVVELERQRHASAQTLRREWAEDLFREGAIAAAILTLLPLHDRPRLQAWLDVAFATAPSEAALLVGVQLTLAPERLPEVRAHVHRWCTSGPSIVRQYAAASLTDAHARCPSKAARVLARPLARALLRDAAAGDAGAVARVDALVNHSTAALADLKTDLIMPALPSPRALATVDTPFTPPLAQLAGALHPLDAAWLVSGHLLVALGELGVRLLRADGSLLHHFDAPAERLSIADGSASAIAITRRDTLMQLTHLDLMRRATRPLGLLALDVIAPTFDGTRLWVADDDSVSALDVHSDPPAALWRVGDFGGPVIAVARDADTMSFVVAADTLVSWTYDLKTLRLDQKRAVTVVEGATLAALHADGRCTLSQDQALWTTQHTGAWDLTPRASTDPFPLPGMERDDVQHVGPWLAVRRRDPDGDQLALLDAAHLIPRLRIELHTDAAMRLASDTLTISYTALGRVYVVALATGDVLADLRLTL